MSGIWSPAATHTLARAPAWLRPWLTENGSLTQRLKTCCGGSFELRVLSESDIKLPEEAASLMGLERGVMARAREVQLCCDDEPCIHARSLLPVSTLTGARAMLGELGTRPLGDALFAFPGLERGPIEIAATDEGWARRSVFRIEGAPLLVAEWFLPALEGCGR